MAATMELSNTELKDLCQQYFKIENLQAISVKELKVLSYEFKPVSDAPTGFLGRHHFLQVKVSLKHKSNAVHNEDLNFFVKSAPIDNQLRMEYLMEFGVFEKEILTYRNVLPTLLTGRFINVAPKCYYANNYLMILENIDALGYKMAAGRDGILDYEHLKCALKYLAALHASSIIFEQRMGKKLNELYPEALQETTYVPGIPKSHIRIQNFYKVMEVLKEMIKAMPKYENKLGFILEQLPKTALIVFELAQPAQKYVNVFNHGDIWANNLLYKYKEDHKTPLECRLVDFQLVRYAPPMLDLMSMLTIPTTKAFRAQHFENLLNDYYNFLKEFLRAENLNIAEILPRHLFEAGAEEFRVFGLVESCLFSHLTVLPAHLTTDLVVSADGFKQFFEEKRVEICMRGFNTDELYRGRMCDMIEDFVDNFILKNSV